MSVKLSKNGKRLGRPPKNKDKIESSPQTFIVESKPYISPEFEISSDDMIECSLVPINEYSHINSENKKAGRYAQSTYSLSKFGKNAFIVLAYLETDLQNHRKSGCSDEQIIRKCVNYLNQEQKKKNKKKPYGNLQLYNFRVINKFNKEIVAIELVTDTRTNENFWGVGTR